MENIELKEKIRRNIKEDIAISNIRKEIDMKISKNKKKFYTISSACAAFILSIGIFVAINNNPLKNDNIKLGKITELHENKEESIEVKLNINKLKDFGIASLDADIKTIEIENIQDKFKFIEQINMPNEYKLENSYNVYVRENNTSKEYNILHDYFFYYRKDERSNIKIAFSEIEKPIRDYFIESGKKISKIGDVELVISQYKKMYIVTFEYENIYFDIETNGITENELVVLLESIINNIKNTDTNKNVEDKDINSKETPTEISTKKYPSYYAGKYIDNNGNNVILLSEDTSENRKQICNSLGISENKTIFKKAKYTYEYLTDLQNKISKKMQNKELPFVTSSSLMEDSNNIRVTVTSNEINDLNKIKELDTIGDALDIRYVTSKAGTEELIIKRENI